MFDLDRIAGSSRYLPPHLREEFPNTSDGNVKLTRQLKGLLNKLSEQNISTILGNIEALYREHRRHDVTTSITSFIIEVVSTHSALLDSHVILHAALVSSLHRTIGAEFGKDTVSSDAVTNSYSSCLFRAERCLLYEHHYSTLASAIAGDALGEPSGKECSNLIVLLSELYNFQVISCILVYDIIRNLLSAELTEFVVELLLKLLRNSGQQLRQDDPSALKDIVQIVQSKTSDTGTTLSSRTRFMLETLINLKNNRVKRAATQHAGGDVTERLKKFLTGLSKTRHLVAHDPLRVSLDDLHSADTRGKWWLVGAAWGGDPLVERQESSKREMNRRDEDVAESTLLKLAKKQGMNTDVRRSIFVVLMSSEDFVDACERLAQLNLTEVQQREVIRVLVNCCGNEKSYNPYYAFVGQHLCRTSHSYKITLQFCLWDFLRGIGESSVGGTEVLKNMKGGDDGFEVKDNSSTKTNNIANAYAWWIAKDCVTLSVFKPVDFTVLKPRTRDFLSHFFRQLFVNSQTSIPTLQSDMPPTRNKDSLEEIFVKAARIQALAMGLVYFLTEMKKGSEEEFIRWAIGVAIDTLRTGLDIVPAL
ncbi:MIF4G-domain-containing protein [Lactarius quietus]|nr:MIF4G-domain-containing protein [Lactarius quietus]